MSLNNDYAIGPGSNEVMHVLHPRLKHRNLWRGCVGAWAPCLGPSGTTLRDNSGRGNHGTLTSMDPATDWSVSGGAYSLDFDGVNDHVLVQDASVYTIGSGGFTVSAWVVLQNTTFTGGVISKRTGFASEDEWNIVYRGDGAETNMGGDKAFAFRINSTSGVAGYRIPGVVTSQWYHVLATSTSAGFATLYVNGVAGSVTGTRAPSADTASTLKIGAMNAASGLWNGKIDDLMIHNRVLSFSEISLLAKRRGIAYETIQRRSRKAAAATGNRRRRLLLTGTN